MVAPWCDQPVRGYIVKHTRSGRFAPRVPSTIVGIDRGELLRPFRGEQVLEGRVIEQVDAPVGVGIEGLAACG